MIYRQPNVAVAPFYTDERLTAFQVDTLTNLPYLLSAFHLQDRLGARIEVEDENQPPLPVPPEYEDGRKGWTAPDGNLFVWNKDKQKWVHVSGPKRRGT
jgi:hypothetical protein